MMRPPLDGEYGLNNQRLLYETTARCDAHDTTSEGQALSGEKSETSTVSDEESEVVQIHWSSGQASRKANLNTPAHRGDLGIVAALGRPS